MPKDIGSSPVLPFPVWARQGEVRRITGVPEKWLLAFRDDHPEAVRKFGEGKRNGARIYNIEAVLAAIDAMGGEVRP